MAAETPNKEPLRESQKAKPPTEVDDRLKRGRARMKEGSAKRTECWKFSRGEQYVFTRDRNLIVQPTTTNITETSGKLPWRVRSTRNLIFDVVEREVSAATSRVPSYEVMPSTTDPEDISAARLAEKLALYGFDAWHIRRVTENVVRHAVVAPGGGFAWPYFDNSIPPFIETEDGTIGMGDIRVRVFGGNEVYWEPGLSFDESRWHGIDQACDPEEVYALDGYVGGKLDLDASRSEEYDRESIRGSKLVMKTDYLERPCAKYPQGRWLTLANGRVILPPTTYPCADYDGEPIDEPVLHQIAYARDPDSDRDQALVPQLLDPQRNINLSVSKAIEWEKLALNPQLVIQNGTLAEGQRLTDEPGAVYNIWGSGGAQWRPVPAIPQELFELKDQAEADMARIAAQNDIPQNVESGKGIEALIEKDQGRRQSFIANLADFHSRLMRHCLYLVQRHYEEERLLKIGGRFPGTIPDFRGEQLRGQADVRVSPGSIEPRTRESVEQKVMNFAQLGWIGPEQAMAAINSGTADNLIESYELDYARANTVIQKIVNGTAMSEPPRATFTGEGMETITDPATGMTQEIQVVNEVPGWMPRPFDNLRVWKQQFEDFMKTSDYDMLDDAGKEQANLVYDTLLQLESKKAAEDAAQQQQMAESMGMGNAAAPQGASPLPSLPGQSNGSGEYQT